MDNYRLPAEVNISPTRSDLAQVITWAKSLRVGKMKYVVEQQIYLLTTIQNIWIYPDILEKYPNFFRFYNLGRKTWRSLGILIWIYIQDPKPTYH